MSSMLSAPAAIPATNEQIFAPALAPLSLGTLNRAWASSPRPARRARAITGTRPAADTRFGSSKTADATVGVWKSRIYEMPFLNRTTELQTSPIVPVQRGILALPHPPGTLTHRWIQAKLLTCDFTCSGGQDLNLRPLGYECSPPCGATPPE